MMMPWQALAEWIRSLSSGGKSFEESRQQNKDRDTSPPFSWRAERLFLVETRRHGVGGHS